MKIQFDTRGSVVIVVAAFFVVLLGFAALVVDVGYLYSQNQQFRSAADAAALAAAQNLTNGLAVTSAQSLALANGLPESMVENGEQFEVVLGSFTSDAGFVAGANPPDAVRVAVSAPRQAFFAGVLNAAGGLNAARAVAQTEALPGTLISMADIELERDAHLKATNDADILVHANGDLDAGGRFSAEASGDDSTLTIETGGEMDEPRIKEKKGGQVVINPDADRLTLPSVNFADLQNKAAAAGQFYPGDRTFTVAALGKQTGVVFVDGDLTITDSTGKKKRGDDGDWEWERDDASRLKDITIVATGTVTVHTEKLKGLRKKKSGAISTYIIAGQDIQVDPCADKLEWVAFRSGRDFVADPTRRKEDCSSKPDADDDADELGKLKLKNSAIFASGDIVMKGVLRADFQNNFRMDEAPFAAAVRVRLVQ